MSYRKRYLLSGRASPLSLYMGAANETRVSCKTENSLESASAVQTVSFVDRDFGRYPGSRARLDPARTAFKTRSAANRRDVVYFRVDVPACEDTAKRIRVIRTINAVSVRPFVKKRRARSM